MESTNDENQENPQERLKRLQEEAVSGPDAQHETREYVTARVGIEEIDRVQSLHTVVQPVYWNDALLNAVEIYLTEKGDKDLMVKAYECFHACLVGYKCSANLQWAIVYILQNTTNPYDERKSKDFGYDWKGHRCGQKILKFDAADHAEAVKHIATASGNSVVKLTSPVIKDSTISVEVNDTKFQKWYKGENYKDISTFMWSLAVVFTRIFVRAPENAYNHCQFRLVAQYGQFFASNVPTILFKANAEHFKALEEYFRKISAFQRGLVKCLLISLTTLKLEGQDQKIRPFCEYAFELSFKNHALHVVKAVDAVRHKLSLNYPQIQEMIKGENMPILNQEFQNVVTMKQIMFKMDRIGLDKSSRDLLPDVSFHFWPYSRFFEGRCFLEASVSKNPHLIAYLSGLLFEAQDEGLMKIVGLAKLKTELSMYREKGIRRYCKHANVPLPKNLQSSPRRRQQPQVSESPMSTDHSDDEQADFLKQD